MEVVKNMPKKQNLIGQKFNRLTVIEEAPTRNKKTFWLCQCDCGNILEVRADQLKSGNTKSCGCLNTETRSKLGKSRIQDISGQKFGKLTAIKRLQTRQNKNLGYDWECLCDCGNHTIVPITYLKNNNTLSCGCLKDSCGEQQIASLLIKLNIKFETQKSFSTLYSKKNRKLKYDFYLPKQNILIEFDGQQHYLKTNYSSEDGLINDQIKNKWSLTHNIPLYRIPYSELNKIEKKENLMNLLNEQYLVKNIDHYNIGLKI